MLLLLLIIIYISFISLGLPDSTLGSIWPSIYGEIGVPISYAGILSMLISGGTIISSFFSGKIIQKFGTGMVTVISVLMTAVALFGFSISNSFIGFILCTVPLGLGAGSVDAALNNYVALHYKAKHMNWLHCFWGVGATIGPIVISYWLISGQWKMGYRTISYLQFALVSILLISLPLWKKVANKQSIQDRNIIELPDTTNPAQVEDLTYSNEKKEDSINTKDSINSNNSTNTHNNINTEGNIQDSTDTNVSISFKKVLQLPGAKAALLAFFSYCAIEATTGLWGSSFLVQARGISEQKAAQWISLFFLGITIGRFLSGFITMIINQKKLVRLGQIIIAAGILLLLIPGTKLLLPGLLMMGFGCAPIFPSLLHQTPVNFGSKYSQAMMGIQMACAYIGTTFVPPIFGFLASRINYQIFQYFLVIILIFMIIMVELLNRGVKKGEYL